MFLKQQTRISRSQVSLIGVYAVLVSLLLLCALALFVTTPFLNYDDVVYNTAYFQQWQTWPYPKLLWMLLINADAAAREFRTYGLSRIIQYHLLLLFGPSPLATYASLISLHALSALALYWALKMVIVDKFCRALIAVVWLANPFVLLISHTFHHHLYLVGPYYFVILWIGVTLNHPRAHWILGAALLTGAWLMGEAVLPVIAILVIASAFDRDRRPSIIHQALAVGVIFVTYVTYQRVAFYDPNVARWSFAAPTTLDIALVRFESFAVDFYNIAVGSLGFEHNEPGARGGPTAGVGLWSSWTFWLPFLTLCAAAFGVQEPVASPSVAAGPNGFRNLSRRVYVGFAILIAAGSCALYLASFIATGMPPLVLRYMIGIGAVAATCLTCIAALFSPSRRIVAVICAVMLCISCSGLLILHRTVYADFTSKVENLAAARSRGIDAVLIYNLLPNAVTRDNASYPALSTSYETPVRTPLSAMWIADFYLRLVLGFKYVGFDYKEIDEHSVEIQGSGVKHVVAKKDLLIAGLVSDTYFAQTPQVNWYADWAHFQATVDAYNAKSGSGN